MGELVMCCHSLCCFCCINGSLVRGFVSLLKSCEISMHWRSVPLWRYLVCHICHRVLSTMSTMSQHMKHHGLRWSFFLWICRVWNSTIIRRKLFTSHFNSRGDIPWRWSPELWILRHDCGSFCQDRTWLSMPGTLPYHHWQLRITSTAKCLLKEI